MTINHIAFDAWFAKLKSYAAQKGWHITEGDEWLSYYARNLSPEQAFDQEIGDDE
ncbi:MAG: hypothetical protein ACK5LG_22155 [Bacteroides thetaiotaomicron]